MPATCWNYPWNGRKFRNDLNIEVFEPGDKSLVLKSLLGRAMFKKFRGFVRSEGTAQKISFPVTEPFLDGLVAANVVIPKGKGMELKALLPRK